MPFRPTLKTWDELTAEEIHAKLTASEADVSAGRVCSQEELDTRIQARMNRG